MEGLKPDRKTELEGRNTSSAVGGRGGKRVVVQGKGKKWETRNAHERTGERKIEARRRKKWGDERQLKHWEGMTGNGSSGRKVQES